VAGPRALRTFSSPVAALISPLIAATSAVFAAIIATVPLNPPSDGAGSEGSAVTVGGATVTVGGGGEVSPADVVAVGLDGGAVALNCVVSGGAGATGLPNSAECAAAKTTKKIADKVISPTPTRFNRRRGAC
jgi:hypothetical protein